MEKIGIIAGNRKFPILVASEARKAGYSVVAIAIKGDTCQAIRKYADKTYWLGLDQFSSLFKILRDEGITKVVMAGQISPRRLFSAEVNKDVMLKELLENIHNKKADTIFSAIAQKLKDNGLELQDSTLFIQNFLPKEGVLTRKEPDVGMLEDIRFGFDLARAIGALDIGQTVAVKDKAVVAVEALEGTDNLILRGGKIGGRGVVIVKVSKPKQDMRFDIPVIGFNTIKNLIRSRARCLAFEAGKTLFIDQKEALALADEKGIVVVAV